MKRIRTHAAAAAAAIVVAALPIVAQQRARVDAPRAAASTASAPNTAEEVLAFERTIEAAVVRGDVAFVDAATAPTFTFTHGDGWTTGGAPLRVDSRADWMATVATVRIARARLGEDGGPRRRRHHLRAIRWTLQGCGARPAHVHRVVRTRIREARWQVAVPLPPHGRRPQLREGLMVFASRRC